MPSPNQLKKKILLKHKRLKADVEKAEMELFLKVINDDSKHHIMMIVIRARLKWTTQLKIQMQPHPRRSPMNQLVKCLNTHHHNILLDLVIILTAIIRDDIIAWIFHIAFSSLIFISKIRRRPSGPSSAHGGHRKDSSKALQLHQLHTGGNI